MSQYADTNMDSGLLAERLVSCTKYSVREGHFSKIIQPVEIFPCEIFSQWVYFSAKYRVSKDIPVPGHTAVVRITGCRGRQG
jgi:hypothetical protein